MTTEEKAKAYDEALERARVLGDGKHFVPYGMTVKEYIFPELRESEDERINRLIYCIVRDVPKADEILQANGLSVDDALSYLEKQKEQKLDIELIQRSWYMEGYKDREFGKEPKWIVKTDEGGPKYESNSKYGQPLEAESKLDDIKREWWNKGYVEGRKNAHIPARELGLPSSWDFQQESKLETFNEPYNPDECEVVMEGNAIILKRKEQKPTEINFEDWDTLGYIRDIVRKHVIRDEEFNVLDKWLTEHYVNQKSAWSEDDEKAKKWLIEYLTRLLNSVEKTSPFGIEVSNAISFVKSFRFQSMQEWNEEDEKMYNSALWHIKNSCGNGGKNSGEYDVYNWLKNRVKSLRPVKQEWSGEDEHNLNKLLQWDGIPLVLRGWVSGLPEKVGTRPSWKPTGEQMVALEITPKYFPQGCPTQLALISLYEQLKKLM